MLIPYLYGTAIGPPWVKQTMIIGIVASGSLYSG